MYFRYYAFPTGRHRYRVPFMPPRNDESPRFPRSTRNMRMRSNTKTSRMSKPDSSPKESRL